MTPVFCCGFECGVDGSHWTVLAPGGSFSTSVVRSGARSARVNVSASQGAFYRLSFPASNVFVIRQYLRIDSNPSVNKLITGCLDTTQIVQSGLAYKASDGLYYAAHDDNVAVTFGSTGIAIATGTFVCVDIKVDASTGTRACDIKVNGVSIGQASYTRAAENLTVYTLGTWYGTSTYDVYFDDIVVSNTAGDYPIGAGYVNHFVAASDGTHTSTGTTTVKGTLAAPTAGGAITAATTDAFNWVNGVPLSGGATDNTRLINAQTAASTTYAEIKFGAAPGISTPTTAPRAVEIVSADREASTAACDFIVKLNDNGTTGDVVNRGNVAGVTSDRYVTKQFATPPTGGAWNAGASGSGAFNNLKARFGFSADATPDIYWRGIMIEAEFAPPIVVAIPNKIKQVNQSVNRGSTF